MDSHTNRILPTAPAVAVSRRFLGLQGAEKSPTRCPRTSKCDRKFIRLADEIYITVATITMASAGSSILDYQRVLAAPSALEN